MQAAQNFRIPKCKICAICVARISVICVPQIGLFLKKGRPTTNVRDGLPSFEYERIYQPDNPS